METKGQWPMDLSPPHRIWMGRRACDGASRACMPAVRQLRCKGRQSRAVDAVPVGIKWLS